MHPPLGVHRDQQLPLDAAYIFVDHGVIVLGIVGWVQAPTNTLAVIELEPYYVPE